MPSHLPGGHHTFIAPIERRQAFIQLDEESRRTILSGPLKEIAFMLDQNLLHKFRQKYGGYHGLQSP